MGSAVVVLDGKIGKLPYPLFPKFRYPFAMGFRFEVAPTVGIQVFTLENLPPTDLELLEVVFMQSGFEDTDRWSLMINGNFVFQSIYTKELGQTKTLKSVKRIDAGQSIQLLYDNHSGTSKVLWIDLDFMSKSLVV